MGLRRHDVMLRREMLLAKISGQREQLAEAAVHLKTPLMFAERALMAGRFVFTHPVLIAGFTGLMVIRRNGLSGMIKGAWRVWAAYRYLSKVARKSS